MADVPYNHNIRFQDLMRHRVREILLVSSLYDSFILAEDGSLYESLLNEFIGLGLTHMPNITRVPRGEEALKLARTPGRFDVIITSLRLEDMHATELAQGIKQVGIEIPVVLLTYDNRELNELVQKGGAAQFDKVFVWQGDFRVLLAIIKFIEDRWNIEHDTRLIGVQSIVVIEDSVKFYSSYLPLIYTAVLEHTEDLIAEGVNPAHKLLRMRARPKIILCETFEEAWSYFETYHDTILGVISDIAFPRGDNPSDKQAGFEFARAVIESHDDIPVLLQSQDAANRARALELGASFLQKGSPVLLHELKRYMRQHFGFGDFQFTLRDGTPVGRARDLRTLEEQLGVVPDESVAYHGERNHFSTWLKSRTEFLLAHRLRPVLISDYASIGEVREHLIRSLREHRREQHRGSIVDFDPDTFDQGRSFARVGSGSLGGKARGIAFAMRLFNANIIEDAFEGVRITIPPSIIVGTDVFDQFIEDNDLWDFAIHSDDDESVTRRFLDARFPDMIAEALSSFLDIVRFPLAVRSSSLLEDSQFMPFAGVYETIMLPNNHPNPEVRKDELIDAITRVYASTFSRAAKAYIRSTPYRIEEEKMAVIVQRLVGVQRENRYYPDFSGVARSHNFYPIEPMVAEDGIASVALGLGRQVVEGGATVRFSPRYPKHLVQFSRVDDILKYSQKDFWALQLPEENGQAASLRLVRETLTTAEADGALAVTGSTYSRENHAIYDGISRPGARIVTFAPILKNEVFPLADILERIMRMGEEGMSSPVEIEFAANLRVPIGECKEFYLLQVRPMVIEQELERLNIRDANPEDMIVRSTSVLGHGNIADIRDIVVVDVDTFERGESMTVAQEVGTFNQVLAENDIPYVLVGVGRWGSADPWLGIPVRWEDIGGARVIVEAGMKDIRVTPSQGTHFFQNITSTRVGYITVDVSTDRCFVDWEWMRSHPALREGRFVRHLRFDEPLEVIMDGRRGEAVVLKPGHGHNHEAIAGNGETNKVDA